MSVFACQFAMLEVFCYRLPGDFKKFIQMAVKLSYAKEKQKLYFLRNPFWKKPRCQDVSPHFMFVHCTSSKMFKGAENFRHRGRLLRNAIPADPGGGVVFFVDPQGAGSS